LPPLDYSSVSWAHAEDAFAQLYPDFEENTGWSADGSSGSKMPEELERKLRDFYREPNELLFQLIGKRYDHWLN
jgi:hypothetical protein